MHALRCDSVLKLGPSEFPGHIIAGCWYHIQFAVRRSVPNFLKPAWQLEPCYRRNELLGSYRVFGHCHKRSSKSTAKPSLCLPWRHAEDRKHGSNHSHPRKLDAGEWTASCQGHQLNRRMKYSGGNETYYRSFVTFICYTSSSASPGKANVSYTTHLIWSHGIYMYKMY